MNLACIVGIILLLGIVMYSTLVATRQKMIITDNLKKSFSKKCKTREKSVIK